MIFPWTRFCAVFTAVREMALTQPSFKGLMGEGKFRQKMESSVMRGHIEEGAANSAWRAGE